MVKLPNELRFALKRIWIMRRIWIPALALMACMVAIGFIMGNKTATDHYKKSLEEVDSAYRAAGEKRRVILEQCLSNNVKLTSRLTELGDKTADVLDKIATERK